MQVNMGLISRPSVFATIISLISASMAQDAQAQDTLAVCAGEISTHCASVVPGHGHVYACLYSHEEKLGEACDEAVADVLDALDGFFELVRYAKQELFWFVCRKTVKNFHRNAKVQLTRLYRRTDNTYRRSKWATSTDGAKRGFYFAIGIR